jgi:hypothetical protein
LFEGKPKVFAEVIGHFCGCFGGGGVFWFPTLHENAAALWTTNMILALLLLLLLLESKLTGHGFGAIGWFAKRSGIVPELHTIFSPSTLQVKLLRTLLKSLPCKGLSYAFATS